MSARAVLLAGWLGFGLTVMAQAANTDAGEKPGDIVEVALLEGDYTTFLRALTEAGLVETLKSPGPFTVFAPTDQAFAKLKAK